MNKMPARPFLKWAGGKTQLLAEIISLIPADYQKDKFTYIEPFVGSGAVLFYLLNHFPTLERAVVFDLNPKLTETYKVLMKYPGELISILQVMQEEYHALEGNELRKKEYYYQKRDLFNFLNNQTVLQAALFIFLNRTCYNGLFRVNKKDQFNVPAGSYKKPVICDRENLMAVSLLLQKVEIACADFEKSIEYVSANTLVYLDPPYRPLSPTSNFNSYSANGFDDVEQKRLANFCRRLDKEAYPWILSNSDSGGSNDSQHFFEELYHGFRIYRVEARRNINSNPQKRGMLNELLITNIQK